MSIRVIVTGGRDYGEKTEGKSRERRVAEVRHVRRVLDDVADALVPVIVVQGGATGADRHARDWAKNWRQECVTFPADWEKYGRSAGPKRNRQMAAAGADLCVAFPGGCGTADMVEAATEAGIPVLDDRENGPRG